MLIEKPITLVGSVDLTEWNVQSQCTMSVLGKVTRIGVRLVCLVRTVEYAEIEPYPYVKPYVSPEQRLKARALKVASILH